MSTARIKLPRQRTASDDKVIDLNAAEQTGATSASTVTVGSTPSVDLRHAAYHPSRKSTRRLADNGDSGLRWNREVRHHQRHDLIDLRDRTTAFLQGLTADIVDDGKSWVEEIFGPPVAVDLP